MTLLKALYHCKYHDIYNMKEVINVDAYKIIMSRQEPWNWCVPCFRKPNILAMKLGGILLYIFCDIRCMWCVNQHRLSMESATIVKTGTEYKNMNVVCLYSVLGMSIEYFWLFIFWTYKNEIFQYKWATANLTLRITRCGNGGNENQFTSFAHVTYNQHVHYCPCRVMPSVRLFFFFKTLLLHMYLNWDFARLEHKSAHIRRGHVKRIQRQRGQTLRERVKA